MKIRELFIDWLTSSRYIRHLEMSSATMRQDFQERLQEKDAIIAALRTELAAEKLESDRMRLILMPLGSVPGAAYAAQYNQKPPVPKQPEFAEPAIASGWEAELQEFLRSDRGQAHALREEQASSGDVA